MTCTCTCCNCPCVRKKQEDTPKDTPKDTPATRPEATRETHIPPSASKYLVPIGYSIDSAETILSLIALPENSTTEWWKNYNYIENLHDGRGYTVTLFGACSGTGDLLMIFEELAKIKPDHPLVKYIPALKKTKGSNVKGLEGLETAIKKLGNDLAWQEAVWQVYVKLYWAFAARFSDKTGDCAKRPGPKLTTPLTRGFMVDAAINAGANLESQMPFIKKMKNPEEQDELKWFLDFAETRRVMLKKGYDDQDTSRTGDRCTLWANIAKAGNMTLRRPIECFKGYWGTYTIK